MKLWNNGTVKRWEIGCGKMAALQKITIEELIERYAVLLLDAYGVLVNDSGALAGAADLIRLLNRTRKPYYLLPPNYPRPPPVDFKITGWK
jgi:hypothetical protein